MSKQENQKSDTTPAAGIVNSQFEAYGRAAREVGSDVVLSGRNPFHSTNMSAIVDDVAKTLAVNDNTSLLEIGCNAGALLVPLAGKVKSATGIDHPNCLEKCRAVGVPTNLDLIAGPWPEAAAQLQGSYDAILIYSVIQCLPGPGEAREFLERAADFLAPGGRMLVGDLPNSDKKRRFLSTDFGRSFEQQYIQRRADAVDADRQAMQKAFELARPMTDFVSDEFLLDLCASFRRRGFHAYLLPQGGNVPFHMTREDLLVERPL